MSILSREQILQAKDLVTEVVEVPEWSGSVLVKSLTGAERDQYESAIVEQKGRDTKVNMRNARARLVALSVVDEEGKRLFSPNDVSLLGAKSAAALQRVFNVSMRLSGISAEDVRELTEELEENPFEDSPSD
jgi:hypothetical protein